MLKRKISILYVFIIFDEYLSLLLSKIIGWNNNLLNVTCFIMIVMLKVIKLIYD